MKTLWVLYFLCNGNDLAGTMPNRQNCENTPYQYHYLHGSKEECESRGITMARSWRWYFTKKLDYEPRCFAPKEIACTEPPIGNVSCFDFRPDQMEN